MIKTEKTLTETTIKHKYCDVCNSKIKKGLYCSTLVCEYCGKDLCEKCIGYEDNSSGDYRTVYCKSCWEIGESHRLKIEKLDDEIETLYDEWITLCKK